MAGSKFTGIDYGLKQKLLFAHSNEQKAKPSVCALRTRTKFVRVRKFVCVRIRTRTNFVRVRIRGMLETAKEMIGEVISEIAMAIVVCGLFGSNHVCSKVHIFF